MITICGWCKAVIAADDWEEEIDYLMGDHHRGMLVSHGLCSWCEAHEFPEIGKDKNNGRDIKEDDR